MGDIERRLWASVAYPLASLPPSEVPLVTVSTILLLLVGMLLVLFGVLAGGNVAFMALGVVALIAAGVLEAWGRRRT